MPDQFLNSEAFCQEKKPLDKNLGLQCKALISFLNVVNFTLKTDGV